VLLGALLLLLALAAAGAIWLARRIAEPVHALKAAATAMQTGAPIDYKATGLVECDEVATALVAAARTLERSREDLRHQVAAAVEQTRQAEQHVSKNQRVEALGRLTGGVAHDFNNLLGVISNSAHLIERQAGSRDLDLPLSTLRRAVDAGALLTQHLLRFAGRRPVRPQRVELTRFLPELQELMRSVLGRRIEISAQVQADSLAVHVDAGELELALVNLALNARDAMQAGGEVRMTASRADAEETEGLPPAPGLGYVQITVSDDGPGIAPELVDRVFEPFFTTKAVGKGSGLGLSQVHGFCTQAGGTVRLATTQGLGTMVSMILPAAPPTIAAADPRHDSDPATDIGGLRVLLVEDNEELSAVTAALLRAHGAIVHQAANADGATLLLRRQTCCDVLLSDVVMPGTMDGLSLARWVKARYPAMGVVLISGFHTTASDSEFVVLHKPCPEDTLLRALRGAIEVPGALGHAQCQ
ncbi:MAG: response regulator, partial [Chitinophagaceae bacterium]|nr:response regulator [Rubrivivax sp.]